MNVAFLFRFTVSWLCVEVALFDVLSNVFHFGPSPQVAGESAMTVSNSGESVVMCDRAMDFIADTEMMDLMADECSVAPTPLEYRDIFRKDRGQE